MVQSVRDLVNKAASTVVEMGVCAGVGYLGARLFNIINPVHGAVYAATAVLVSKITEPLFEKIFGGPEANEDSKFLGRVINIGVCVGISGAISTAIGFPISFGAGIALWVIVVITRTAIDAINKQNQNRGVFA